MGDNFSIPINLKNAMNKFTLLIIFLIISVYWIYQPFSINATDEMIDKYRPSLHLDLDSNPKDSILPVKTYFKNHATAFHFIIHS